KRVMLKLKHERTADCAVAGFRWHKYGDGVGSLLLGLYDDAGALHHVGVATSFSVAMRKQLVEELEPLRANAVEGHPWQSWAEAQLRSEERRVGKRGGRGGRRRCTGGRR